MTRWWTPLIALLALAGSAAAEPEKPAPTGDKLGLSVPRGSKLIADQVWESRRGFRQTVQFYTRLFKRKGLEPTVIPTYRYRGVEVIRFLAPGDRHPWMAVQVFRRRGRTRIAIVPRPPQPADPAPKKPAPEPPSDP